MNDVFSILFDESTNVKTSKHGAILIRYFNESLEKITTSLWDLPEVYDENVENCNEGAEHLHHIIERSFDQFEDVPEENLLAFSSDTCNTMVGDTSGVATRLEAEHPGIVRVGCPCHGAHFVHSIQPRVCMELSPIKCQKYEIFWRSSGWKTHV